MRHSAFLSMLLVRDHGHAILGTIRMGSSASDRSGSDCSNKKKSGGSMVRTATVRAAL